MSSSVMLKIKNALKSARSAVIVGHIDPDADSIGSVISSASMLQKLGIRPFMLSVDGVPETYRFLPGADAIKTSLPPDARFDVAIVVDAGDIRRIGKNIDLRAVCKDIINIDHHSDNTMFGTINLVRPASSSAEIIYDLCKFLHVPVSKDMAKCLYTAIITDTGNFRYENTLVSTFTIAADLVRAGVSPNRISTSIYDTKSVSFLKILALALQRMESAASGRVVWTSVTSQMINSVKAQGDELTAIIDHLRSLDQVEVAVLFRETKDGIIKINFRSREKINVQKIAKELGGGGHVRAAGVLIKGSLSSVKQKVLKVVLKYLK